MMTLTEIDGRFRYHCDECDRACTLTKRVPYGHRCKDGKIKTLWPEGFVAEKQEKQTTAVTPPPAPRNQLTSEQRAVLAEERRQRLAEHKAQLGSKIEEFLTSWGVTTEWWVAFKESHGLPPSCNCAARKEWFNRIGESLPWAAGIGVKLLEYLTRKPPADNAL